MQLPKSTRADLVKLALSGFIQVALVGINTWQIAHDKLAGAVVVSFGISFFWTYNIKKVAFGGMRDRLAYAGGAAVGCLAGVALSKLFYNLF